MFVERNTTGVEGFTTANWAAQRTDTTGVDANTGTLGNVFNNRTGSGVDGVQAVAALDQNTRAELASWGAHARHNRRMQRNFEQGNRIVKTLLLRGC